MTAPVAYTTPGQAGPAGLRLLPYGPVDAVFPTKCARHARARLALQGMLYNAFDPVLSAGRHSAPDGEALAGALRRVTGRCQISVALCAAGPVGPSAREGGRGYLRQAVGRKVAKGRAEDMARLVLGSFEAKYGDDSIRFRKHAAGFVAHLLVARLDCGSVIRDLQSRAETYVAVEDGLTVTITGPWPPGGSLWSGTSA